MLYNCHDVAGYAASLPLVAPAGYGVELLERHRPTSSRASCAQRSETRDITTGRARALFDPLGMGSAVLEPDGSGTFVCSSYMLATARDWARFGQLFLDGGRVDGRQILLRRLDPLQHDADVRSRRTAASGHTGGSR